MQNQLLGVVEACYQCMEAAMHDQLAAASWGTHGGCTPALSQRCQRILVELRDSTE